MYKFSLIFSGIFWLTACSPGSADYQVRLGESDFYFDDTNSANRQIIQKHSNGTINVIVGSTVLDYKLLGSKVVGVRQVINEYQCDEGHTGFEVLNTFAYWIFDISKDESLHVYEYDKYLEVVKSMDFPEAERLKSPSELSSIALPIKELSNCVNPRVR